MGVSIGRSRSAKWYVDVMESVVEHIKEWPVDKVEEVVEVQVGGGTNKVTQLGGNKKMEFRRHTCCWDPAQNHPE